MAETLTHKLLRAHLAKGSLAPGQDITVAVDQVLVEDATGTMTAMQFEQLGTSEIAVPLAVMYVDHNVLQIDDKNMQDHRYPRNGLRASFGTASCPCSQALECHRGEVFWMCFVLLSGMRLWRRPRRGADAIPS